MKPRNPPLFTLRSHLLRKLRLWYDPVIPLFSADLTTYLQLNGGTLDGATLSVSSETEHEDEHPGTQKDGEPDQTDKPRAASEFIFLLNIIRFINLVITSCCGVPRQGIRFVKRHSASRY